MTISSEFWRDQRIPYIESRRVQGVGGRFRAHSHLSFTIGVLDRGTMLFTCDDGGAHLLTPGAVVSVPPERVHGCNSVTGDRWSYQLLNLNSSWISSLTESTRSRNADWSQEPIKIYRHGDKYSKFCQLNTLLFSAAPLDQKIITLSAFVGDLRADRGEPLAEVRQPSVHSSSLSTVMSYLCENMTRKPALTDLAAFVGMDKYQLIRAFRTETGLTPFAWQADRRIQRARLKILEGESLAGIAESLGFADQSHFQRVFKAYVGVTPMQYRG